MSRNIDHLFDKCRSSSGLNIKNLPEFVGSLSSCKVGIVFDKAQTAFQNECMYEKDDNEQQVTSTSSDNVVLLPSTSRSSGYGVSTEKNEDAFTKTLKMMKRSKPESNTDINPYKRKIEKSSTKYDVFTNRMSEETSVKKNLKNDLRTENLYFPGNKLNDTKSKGKLKFNKIIKGGYQEPNIDYLFEDDIDPSKSSNKNVLDDLDYFNDYSKESGFKKLPDSHSIENQESSDMFSLAGSVLSKAGLSLDKARITFKADFKHKEDNKRFENYDSNIETRRQPENFNSSDGHLTYSSLPNYEHEDSEKKIKKVFEPTTKRTFNSSFVIPKKNVVESNKNTNNSQTTTKKINSDFQKSFGTDTSRHVKKYSKELNHKVYSDLAKDKHKNDNEYNIINKKKSDFILCSNEKDNSTSSWLPSKLPETLPTLKSDLLDGNKLQNILSTINEKKFDSKNSFDLYNENQSDVDFSEVTQVNESKDFEEVEIELEYEEKVSRGFELDDLPKIFGNLLSSKVGFILEKASKYKPSVEEITSDISKQFVSASTSTALKKFSSVATEASFSTSNANTQTIKKETVSCDTQTPSVFMVSVGTQTSPVVIKKRTVGIQSAIYKNQTVGTQTRKPKMSSGGTQTLEQKHHQYSDTTSLNQSQVYKEHVYAQEDVSDGYFSNAPSSFSTPPSSLLTRSNPILVQNFFNDSHNSTYSIEQTDNKIEEEKFNEEDLVERPESATQPLLEYSPSMIERVLNIIHGR